MTRELIQQWLSKEFLGNTVGDYVIALGVFLAVIVAVWIVKSVIVSRLRRLADRTGRPNVV